MYKSSILAVLFLIAATLVGIAGELPATPRKSDLPVVELQRVQNPPLLQMLVPGMTVRELPVTLTNINNVAYAPDGRLFAAGYDGRIHVLRDTNGDGLEDAVTTFYDKVSADYPIGMTFQDN